MSQIYQVREKCLLCRHTQFDSVLDLGELHLNAFPLPHEEDPPKSPLHVVRCRECGLLQLRETVNPDLLYREYWYRSGTNQTMRDALKDVVTGLPVELRPFDTVVDIGSNDNTLLKAYSDVCSTEVSSRLHRVGFEPSNIGAEAMSRAGMEITVINDYFAYRPWLDRKAKVVTSIAMFYGLQDPHPFVEDVRSILHPDGVWILQLAYLPSILKRVAFDGICHEHVSYYSLATLERLLGQHGLHVFDAKLIDINEGSIRLYIRSGPVTPTVRLLEIRAAEKAWELDTFAPYQRFAEHVALVKGRVLRYVDGLASQGLLVHGYGASTKGNTLLQYFGIRDHQVQAIWERQPQKFGRQTVGTRIPIISEEEGRARNPDALLVLPWHFAPEFIEREAEYLANGGEIIIPLPDFRVVKEVVQ